MKTEFSEHSLQFSFKKWERQNLWYKSFSQSFVPPGVTRQNLKIETIGEAKKKNTETKQETTMKEK